MPPLTGSKSEKLRAKIIAMLTGKIGDALVLAGPVEPVAGCTSHQKARDRRRLSGRGWRHCDKSDGGSDDPRHQMHRAFPLFGQRSGKPVKLATGRQRAFWAESFQDVQKENFFLRRHFGGCTASLARPHPPVRPLSLFAIA